MFRAFRENLVPAHRSAGLINPASGPYLPPDKDTPESVLDASPEKATECYFIMDVMDREDGLSWRKRSFAMEATPGPLADGRCKFAGVLARKPVTIALFQNPCN